MLILQTFFSGSDSPLQQNPKFEIFSPNIYFKLWFPSGAVQQNGCSVFLIFFPPWFSNTTGKEITCQVVTYRDNWYFSLHPVPKNRWILLKKNPPSALGNILPSPKGSLCWRLPSEICRIWSYRWLGLIKNILRKGICKSQPQKIRNYRTN